jgi:Flp pilus assembly protein TadG
MSSSPIRYSRCLARGERGSTATEFALVAPILLMLMLGLLDLGFRQYIASQLQGSLDQAARTVTVGGVSSSTVSDFVSTRIHRILPGATVNVTTKNYDDFASVGKPEPITTDTAPLGTYNTGDCFLDENGNGVWDADSGNSGAGGSDDIVYYTAVVTYPALLPLGRMLGWPSTESVQGSMMMRNQPYASQPQAVTRCT